METFLEEAVLPTPYNLSSYNSSLFPKVLLCWLQQVYLPDKAICLLIYVAEEVKNSQATRPTTS